MKVSQLIDLKPCPFCGSTKTKVDKKAIKWGTSGLGERIEYHTYSVRCNVCHTRGPAFGGKVILFPTRLPIPNFITTPDVLKCKAIDGWNRRIEK